MSASSLLERARLGAGLTQEQMAQRSATQRTAISAYEHGRKTPSVDTFERLLAGAGYTLEVHRNTQFVETVGPRGHRYLVPTHLPHLEPHEAFATVNLPLHLNWSDEGRSYRMSNRSDRSRVYEAVLTNGGPDDILRYVDGALLVDMFEELMLSREVRAVWTPVIDDALTARAA